jgi:large subunit ribosomal protein L10
MNRTQKADEVTQIRDKFDRMVNAILTDFRGLNVEAMTSLRRLFRKADVEYRVVKNTLVLRAVSDLPFADDIAPHLTQMTGIAWSYADPSAAAKVIRDFTKDNDKLKLKCGVMDGRVEVVDLATWSTLPSRETLLAMIAGQLVAAPQAILSQMVSPAQQIVSLIDAWKEKLEKNNTQPGATE